jgi:DNA-binding transcriptional MerR regulator
MSAALAMDGNARGKSPEAFRTISEVAVELDVPQHVLRFWESRFAQVKPVKRGGGRRYYRPEDVDLLRGIRTLLYSDGFTIKGVQKLIREQGVRYVAGLGRADCSLIGRLAQVDNDAPRHARAAIAAVEAAHRDALRAEAPAQAAALAERPAGPGLDEARRVKLELLLAELLQLKARLTGAPSLPPTAMAAE